MTTPSVNRAVHYVSYGSAGGEFTSQCRAATVTEIPADVSETSKVGLVVLNPTGFFFRPLADGGCDYDGSPEPRGGTWHWPERV